MKNTPSRKPRPKNARTDATKRMATRENLAQLSNKLKFQIPEDIPMEVFNAKLSVSGAATSEYSVSHTAHYVDLAGSLLSNNVYTKLWEKLFDQYINAYYASVGYTPTTKVTAADIRNYLTYSVNMLGLAAALWRYYSGKNTVCKQGLPLGDIVSSHAYGSVYGASYIKDIIEDTVGSMNTENGSMSNAEWSQTVLSELVKLRMPTSWSTLAMKLFTSVYNVGTNKGVSSYVAPYPAVAKSTSKLYTLFASQLTSLNGLLTSLPDILPVLNGLFPAKPWIDFDWSRKLQGDVINFIYGSEYEMALYLGYDTEFTANVDSDDDTKYLLQFPQAQDELFNWENSVNIPISSIALPLLIGRRFGNTANSLSGVIRVRSIAGTWTTVAMLNPIVIKNFATDTSITNAAVFTRLGYAQGRYQDFFGLNAPATVGIELTISSSYAVVAGISIVNEVKTNGSTFILRSDYAFDIEKVKADLILGANYRASLQQTISNAFSQHGTYSK